jgi:hypothetical protein
MISVVVLLISMLFYSFCYLFLFAYKSRSSCVVEARPAIFGSCGAMIEKLIIIPMLVYLLRSWNKSNMMSWLIWSVEGLKVGMV